MDISKHLEFFNPITDLTAPCHIIGCGAIGSTVIEMLVRMGVENIHIYDFDKITSHNLANQMFVHADIGNEKVYAIESMITSINPDLTTDTGLTIHKEGYTNQKLSGYIFLCVDNIDLRREIATNNKYNPHIKAMFDFRMRLTDAQHYAANWSKPNSIEDFLNTMAFTHDEAKEATPINACGTTMNIIPIVRLIVSLGLGNFINFVKKGELKKMILADAFSFIVDAF